MPTHKATGDTEERRAESWALEEVFGLETQGKGGSAQGRARAHQSEPENRKARTVLTGQHWKLRGPPPTPSLIVV